MIEFYASMFIVGILGAAAVVALHRLNERMTRQTLAGMTARSAPERATGHLWAFSDAGARVVPAMTATADSSGFRGHSAGPQTVYREYASSVPRVVKGTQTVRRYRKNALGDATAGAIEITNTVPHHAPSATSDVFVPLMQAAITAIVVTLAIGVLAVIAGRTDVVRIVGVSFVVTLCGAWAWRLGIVTSLLTTIERVTQDLDDEEEEADDPAHGMIINAPAARQDAARKERSSERAMRLADLLAFSQRCATVGCAERSQSIRAGTPQQEAYRIKRDLLITLGIGKWKAPENHNAGWVLTVNQTEAAEILRSHVMDVSST